jgi:hypothetical protein
MNIDHIFIFTNDFGKVADELVAFGLSEGSSRIHAGQGTTNRKFYFDNFFLEILWVHDPDEIKSSSVESSGLWNRANFANNNHSPFGLCIVNEGELNSIFEQAYIYQPKYFPNGIAIEVLKNEDQPSLPWTFRLPFIGHNKHESEPKNHKSGIKHLTKATFEYDGQANDPFLSHFKNEKQIQFDKTERNWLTLIFDDAANEKMIDFKALRLTIKY